jgi:hypothetical protein
MKNIPPAGEYPYIDNKFIEHPVTIQMLAKWFWKALSKTILCRMPFRIKKDKTTVFKKLNSVSKRLIGLNEDFVLDKYEIDLTQYPTDWAQQFNVDHHHSKLNSEQ